MISRLFLTIGIPNIYDVTNQGMIKLYQLKWFGESPFSPIVSVGQLAERKSKIHSDSSISSRNLAIGISNHLIAHFTPFP